MSHIELSNVARIKMLSLVTELAGARSRQLAAALAGGIGRLDVQAYFHGTLLASVVLDGEGIEFGCYAGIHGRLFPAFGLDDTSFRRTTSGLPITEVVAMRALRVCFARADEIKFEDDQEDIDDETFVVDPALEQDLLEIYHT